MESLFRYYNPNPYGFSVGDCVIRAISCVLNMDWEETFIKLSIHAFQMGDMPSANYVWGTFLTKYGFKREMLPDRCPECYTIADFAYDHPRGEYILATGQHVIAVIDGYYYDSWDSGMEVPSFYFRRS